MKHAMCANLVRTCCFHRLHGLLLKSDLPEKVNMHVLVAAPHAQRAHGILDPDCISGIVSGTATPRKGTRRWCLARQQSAQARKRTHQ